MAAVGGEGVLADVGGGEVAVFELSGFGDVVGFFDFFLVVVDAGVGGLDAGSA